jgi:hypothetical protein
MPLDVTECQVSKTWYQLTGDLSASELYPKLLPNSQSVVEIDDPIETEPEEQDGQYDGASADDGEMENEIAEFTKAAIAEFHDEALAAAKTTLTSLKPSQTLLHADFESEEEEILEEAANVLGTAVPWDPIEAAQDAVRRAENELRELQRKRAEELTNQQIAEVLQKAEPLLRAGNSHATVRAMFPPEFSGKIANLVGELRSQGVRIEPGFKQPEQANSAPAPQAEERFIPPFREW